MTPENERLLHHHHESGRLAAWAREAVVAAGCAVCCGVLLWLGFFVAVCVLLARDNTAAVRGRCNGMWDFVLVSILAPFAMPLVYCAMSCWLGYGWNIFSGVTCGVMGTVSMHLAFATSAECVDALGEPPLLLGVVYIKAILYGMGAFSALFAELSKKK